MQTSTENIELRAALDQCMLAAAYRQQIEAMRGGIYTRLPVSENEIAQTLDLLEEASLLLTAFMEGQTSDIEA
jgi:hypothetical protein